MMEIKGKDIIVQVGGVAVAAAKSGTIILDMEMLEVAPQTAGNYREYLPKRLSWKIATVQLLTNVRTTLLSVGQRVAVRFYANTLTESESTGEAFVTKCQITAQRGSLATAQIELTGTDRLDRYTHDLFWGTVLSQYVTTSDGKKLRILRER